MAKKTAVEKTAVEETPTEVVASGKGVATVSWRGNTREYSKELHGSDYRELAKEFAVKVDGKVA